MAKKKKAEKKAAKKAAAAKASKKAPAKKAVKASARSKTLTPKQVVRAIEKAWDSGRLDKLDPLFAPSFAPGSGVPMLPPGLEGAKIAHGLAMQAFPDRKTEIVDIFGEGNRVCVRMRVTGSNQGGVPWLGAPANGNPIDFQWVSIYEIKNGKATNHWGVIDTQALMMQTGAWSPPQM